MDTVNQIWEQVLEYIRPRLSQIAFDVYIKCMEPRNIEDGEMVVTVRTDFLKQNIIKLYSELLLEALHSILGIPLGLRIISLENAAEDNGTAAALPIQGNGFPTALADEEYTFENFVVGSTNNFAYAACRAVAENPPATRYNPLFIHGGSGLGKTHLLCAICKEMQKRNPHIRILYTKGETMTNELIEAIHNGTTAEFRAKYRQVDVLLVDDIQFIGGKVATQEEFFHTFDHLHSNGKQIVLTSDRPPREIATLEERLQSRFEMDLMADVQPPDYETRVAIIRRKAQMLDLPLPDEVAQYIASQLKSNIRQLEGVVKRMKAQYLLNNEPPTMAAAQNAIRDIRNDNQPVPITVERIITEVARTMNVTPEDIRSTKQSAPVSRARQMAIYVVRTITNLPMKSIGKEFGDRDHTTIVYAIQKVETQMAKDPNFRNMVNDIIKNISES